MLNYEFTIRNQFSYNVYTERYTEHNTEEDLWDHYLMIDQPDKCLLVVS